MAQITLRNIDPQVKRLLKMEAAKQDKSLKDFILSRLSQDLSNRKRNSKRKHQEKT